MKWNRRDWALLLSVTLLAAVLRFYKLGEVPPGFQFDEAFNAIDAEQIWYGNRPLFLPANGGREALYSYFQALLGTFLGFHVYSLRLASALVGIGAVAATYWLLRTILTRNSRTIALCTSVTLAISFWHLHFSHYGIRVITMPLILSGLFGAYWLAHHAERSSSRWWALLVSGILTGLTVWTHPSGRFVPFILLAYTAWLLWRSPKERRLAVDSAVGILFMTGVIAFLVFLPLGIEFYRHPDFFFGHASEVSIFADRVSGDQPWVALLANIFHVLGMFNFAGDVEWAHNLAGRPVFDPLLSIPFLLGVGLWAGRLWRRREDDPDVNALVLLAIWAFVMLMPSVLSEAAPNYSRTMPSLPATFLPVGLGLSWLMERVQRWRTNRPATRLPEWSGAALAGLLLTISGVWASYDFFVRFPQRPESYYAYDADKLDALAALEKLADEGYEVFLQPLWADHATFTFLRSNSRIKALDPVETLVLPPVGQGVVYAFPGEKLTRAEQVAERWPGIQAEEILDAYGKRLLAMVRVDTPRSNAWPDDFQPTNTLDVRFDDGPTLLGMKAHKERNEVTLFWRAEAPTHRSLTAFLHFIDNDGRRVAQVDKLPGNGSYLTPVWSPGERVVERYPFEVSDPCAGGATVDVVTGWYELAADGQRRPRLDGAGDSVVAGQVTLPTRSYRPDEIGIPNPVTLALPSDLQIVGYQVQTDPLRAGAPITVDLYWRGGVALPTSPITLRLLVRDERLELWQGAIAPTLAAAPATTEVVCQRVRTMLPSTLAPGNYQLEVAQNDTFIALTTLTLQP